MTGAGRMRAGQSQAGFTMMEMLVAVTLVAVMAVGLWAVFRIALRSWSRGIEFMDVNQRHRSILSLVRKQMASAYASYVLTDREDPGSAKIVFSGSADRLMFISLNSLRFRESPGLTVVSYGIEQAKDGEYSLLERETRFLGQMPEETSFGNGSNAIPIFEKLSSCLFEYFDPGDDNTPPQWVQEWNAEKEGRLPLAVSVSMIAQDARGVPFTRHMVVPIQAQPLETRINYVNPFQPGRPVRR